MRRWDLIDHAPVPDDDGTMYLMNRGSEYAILVNQYQLMNNRRHSSEDALADLACDRLDAVGDTRILIGGLGMGFTLAAALRRVGPGGRCTVAELSPAVVDWNRQYVGRAARHPLRDPRVTVHVGDVGDLIDGVDAAWDSVLLDIDNGPAALTRQTNGWLYTREGITHIKRALRPGGVLGIWSAISNRPFTRRLRVAGFQVEVLQHVEQDPQRPDEYHEHVLWMARLPGA